MYKIFLRLKNYIGKIQINKLLKNLSNINKIRKKIIHLKKNYYMKNIYKKIFIIPKINNQKIFKICKKKKYIK